MTFEHMFNYKDSTTKGTQITIKCKKYDTHLTCTHCVFPVL